MNERQEKTEISDVIKKVTNDKVGLHKYTLKDF